MPRDQEVEGHLAGLHRLEQELKLQRVLGMVEALLGTVDDQEPIDQMLVISRHIFQLILIQVILLVIFYAVELDLHELGRGGPALGGEVGDHLAFVDLGDALDGEGPEDLLADHHQDLAFVHAAGVGDERERDLQDAEGFDLELRLRGVEQAEDLLAR